MAMIQAHVPLWSWLRPRGPFALGPHAHAGKCGKCLAVRAGLTLPSGSVRRVGAIMLLHLSRQGLGSGEVDDGEVIFMPAARARKITHPCEPAHGAAQKLPLFHTSLEARRIIYHASYKWRQELYNVGAG